MRVTVAAGIDAPLGSLTVPRNSPPVLCAIPNGAANSRTRAAMERKRILRRLRAWRCPCRGAIFMNSPLVPKNSLGSEFFEVAVPRKPYYNPANLEKAGSRVKRKEFLQAISKSSGAAPPAHQRSGAARGRLFFRAAGV